MVRMSDKKVQFLPFHAINEFMMPEYRLEVIQTVFAALDELPADIRGSLNQAIKSQVRVPGFRNSALAPLAIKVRGAVSTFGRDPRFVAQVLAGWSAVHADLMQQIYDLLKERGWEVLPPEADRRKLPGFLTRWLKKDDFDVLQQAFRSKYPEVEQSDNNISLIAVWVSGRLPVDMVEDVAEDAAEEANETGAEPA